MASREPQIAPVGICVRVTEGAVIAYFCRRDTLEDICEISRMTPQILANKEAMEKWNEALTLLAKDALSDILGIPKDAVQAVFKENVSDRN